MQDQGLGLVLADEAAVPKPNKKKPSTQKVYKVHSQGMNNVKKLEEVMQPQLIPTGQKSSKRGIRNVSPLTFQQPEKSTSDSLGESSAAGNHYRTLRRKCLQLEEESFGLGRELREVEDEIKSLEGEKIAILDELVVLEGLVEPSEFQPGLH